MSAARTGCLFVKSGVRTIKQQQWSIERLHMVMVQGWWLTYVMRYWQLGILWLPKSRPTLDSGSQRPVEHLWLNTWIAVVDATGRRTGEALLESWFCLGLSSRMIGLVNRIWTKERESEREKVVHWNEHCTMAHHPILDFNHLACVCYPCGCGGGRGSLSSSAQLGSTRKWKPLRGTSIN